VEILQRVAADVLVVGAEDDRFADLPVRAVPDLVPGAGVLGGIWSALEAATAPVVLVVGCDHPFLSAELLMTLVERALENGCDGAWVHSAKGVEPLVAAYRRSARHAIGRLFNEGERAAHRIGAALAMAQLEEADLEKFGVPDELTTNINTPDDYRRVQYPPA
jgi:molybdopterin-guanine dinucleotide biosynthesis protein A